MTNIKTIDDQLNKSKKVHELERIIMLLDNSIIIFSNSINLNAENLQLNSNNLSVASHKMKEYAEKCKYFRIAIKQGTNPSLVQELSGFSDTVKNLENIFRIIGSILDIFERQCKFHQQQNIQDLNDEIYLFGNTLIAAMAEFDMTDNSFHESLFNIPSNDATDFLIPNYKYIHPLIASTLSLCNTLLDAHSYLPTNFKR